MNKKLIAILTLVIFALTLMPMGAFAATKNTTVGAVPNVRDTGNFTLASLRINEDIDGNFAANDTMVLTLPTGVEWQAQGIIQTAVDTANAGIAGYTAGDIAVVRASSRVLNVTLTGAAVTAGVDVVIIPMLVNVTTVGSGDLTVNLAAPGTAITEGNYVIGRFVTGRATATALTAPTRSEGNQTFGSIRVTETALGSLNARTIIMRLPNGFVWQAVPTATISNNTTVAQTGGAVGTRNMEFTVTSPGTQGQAIIDFTTPVTVEAGARFGDLMVSFSGTADLSGDLKIGAYGELGVDVTAASAKDLEAGKDAQRIANIKIKDKIAGSLIANRTIRMTLPEGTRWAAAAAPAVTNVSGTLGAGVLSNDDRTATYTVTAVAGTTEFEFRSADIEIAANFSGPVVVDVTGTAGASGKVTVAEVQSLVTAEGSTAPIRIGVQGQEVNDFYITENIKEALRASGVAVDRTLLIRLPEGFTWSRVPAVEVVEGNLGVDTVTRANTNRDISILLDGESTTPSKLRISNAAISTNRSIPEGNVNAVILGGAVMQNANVFTNVTTAGSFRVAVVTTPAEDGVVQPVVMTVGSTVYSVDGVEMTMDVAPYVKGGRTFFPVRFVASAVGISEDNVVWDGAQRTVTIFRGNRIVQVTIDSTTMLVNGIPLTMDVAPEITAGRTMLPIRFVAQGLNVNVNWDAATQTVTLN